MSEQEKAWMNSGVLHGTWKALDITPPRRANNPKLTPAQAVYADFNRLTEEVAARVADGRLPAPPMGQEYRLQLDGLYLRAISPEGIQP